jgi:hypothetical protein
MESKICKRPDCGKTFPAKKKRGKQKVYCSTRCKFQHYSERNLEAFKNVYGALALMVVNDERECTCIPVGMISNPVSGKCAYCIAKETLEKYKPK